MEIFDQKQEFQTKNWKKNLFGLKKMFLQIFLAEFFFGRMIIFFKSLNIFSQKKSYSEKIFWSTIFVIFIFKNFGSEKNYCQKSFGSEKNILTDFFWLDFFDGFLLARSK